MPFLSRLVIFQLFLCQLPMLKSPFLHLVNLFVLWIFFRVLVLCQLKNLLLKISSPPAVDTRDAMDVDTESLYVSENSVAVDDSIEVALNVSPPSALTQNKPPHRARKPCLNEPPPIPRGITPERIASPARDASGPFDTSVSASACACLPRCSLGT